MIRNIERMEILPTTKRSEALCLGLNFFRVYISWFSIRLDPGQLPPQTLNMYMLESENFTLDLLPNS